MTSAPPSEGARFSVTYRHRGGDADSPAGSPPRSFSFVVRRQPGISDVTDRGEADNPAGHDEHRANGLGGCFSPMSSASQRTGARRRDVVGSTKPLEALR